MSELQNKVEIHMEHIGMVYPADGKEVTALTDVTLDIQKEWCIMRKKTGD
ncbi:hypothetical protein [Ruminococcus sp.]